MRALPIAACVLSLATTAKADEELVRGEGVEVTECDFLPEYDAVLPWHWLEASGGFSSHLNYNFGEVHFRGALALELLFLPPERQELRFGAYTSFGAGLWGDDKHGGFSPEVGGVFKLSAMPGEPFDVYILMGGGYLWGERDGGHDALHLRAGGGARVMRAVALELAGSALFGTFDADGRLVHWVPGGILQANVNLCAFVDGCNYPPPRQRTHDRTCELYDRANIECAQTKNKARLCRALDEALDVEANPPTVRGDATSTYLQVTAQLLGTDCGPGPKDPVQASICRLVYGHDELRAWLMEGRGRERSAALRGRALRHLWRYEPYPVALRRALGCGYPRECLDVCETREDDD
ncbi:MAG TPA: hypothetical protein VFB62_04445 [Polyangiaceae bacterium]|jgi:hypothetical protein|nr:hypothetical protein [Polyangiaceae bacterium]